MSNHRFEAVYDTDYDLYIVRVCSYAFAQSRVPVEHTHEFEDKATALEQVRRLHKWQAKGNVITTRNAWTSRRLRDGRRHEIWLRLVITGRPTGRLLTPKQESHRAPR